MSRPSSAVQVEAVLCEDGRTIMLYTYQGEELIHTQMQTLPMSISEESFEDMRAEWEQSWGINGG